MLSLSTLIIRIVQDGESVGVSPNLPEEVTVLQLIYVTIVLIAAPVTTTLVAWFLTNRKVNKVQEQNQEGIKTVAETAATVNEEVKEQIQQVVHEVKPNSGSSMADKINKTADTVAYLAPALVDLTDKLEAHLTDTAPLNDYVRKQMEREEYERERYRPRRSRRRY